MFMGQGRLSVQQPLNQAAGLLLWRLAVYHCGSCDKCCGMLGNYVHQGFELDKEYREYSYN
jgi:hypothetical protein